VEGEIQFVGYHVTDQDDKLQAMRTWQKIGLDQIMGLILAFFIGNTSPLTDRAGIHVVPGREHHGQHLVWNHMHYKSCVVVAGKSHIRSTGGTKWE